MHESAYDVTEYGAAGDGETRDTDAIQSALDDCADSGGTVYLPPGEYLTAPLTVGSDTTLHLPAGATIKFARDYEAFPDFESRWEGWDKWGFHPCLLVEGENVEITGRGTVDGQGDYWWQFYGADDDEVPDGLQDRLDRFAERNDKSDDVSSFTLRPPLFQINDSENVSVSGITLRRSPFWNTHVLYSENVTIHDVDVLNPAKGAPNGDGIDIDSSQYVRISDAYINAGDDAICIKSGKNAEGREVGEPASQITVTNCTVQAGHGGVVIGSEMSGSVRDVTVSNCTFTDTDRGIRIKTARDRGGVVEDLRFDTIVMRRIASPFTINGYYFMDINSDPIPVDDGTPLVRNVNFHDITAREVESAGFFAGLPEQHFGEITFDNVDIDATRPLDATDLSPAMADGYDQRHGLFCKSISEISFSDVRIRTADGPALAFEEVDQVSIEGVEFPDDQEGPQIELTDVEETFVREIETTPEDGPFVSVRGEEAGRLSLSGNHAPVEEEVEVADGADPDVDSA